VLEYCSLHWTRVDIACSLTWGSYGVFGCDSRTLFTAFWSFLPGKYQCFSRIQTMRGETENQQCKGVEVFPGIHCLGKLYRGGFQADPGRCLKVSAPPHQDWLNIVEMHIGLSHYWKELKLTSVWGVGAGRIVCFETKSKGRSPKPEQEQISDLWLWDWLKPNVALMLSCTPSNNVLCPIQLGQCVWSIVQCPRHHQRQQVFFVVSSKNGSFHFFCRTDITQHMENLFYRLGIADLIGS